MGDYVIQVGNTSIESTSNVNSVGVYNLTANVVRMTKVNGAFGPAETPVNIVLSMPCSINWLSGKEKILFNKETHVLDGVLSCRVPAGVTIVVTDKIYYDSKYYEILDVKDVNNLGALLQIAIKRIK